MYFIVLKPNFTKHFRLDSITVFLLLLGLLGVLIKDQPAVSAGRQQLSLFQVSWILFGKPHSPLSLSS